ncbi:MAG: DnaB-like helicase C-terminal domain-containing protein [Betaproteobacteria bacterium]
MQLSEHGILLRNQSVGDHKTTCPQCSHLRKNKKDPCLSVTITDDGGAVWKCHHCDWVGNIPSTNYEYRKPQTVSYVKPKLPPVEQRKTNDALSTWFEKRSIPQQVWKDFGIYLDDRGSNSSRIAFPYFLDGEVVNVKYRSFDKKFSQEPKARRTLFNIDRLKELWRSGHHRNDEKQVIFVEGEMDVLAMAAAGFVAVSLPDGAPQQTKLDPDDKRFAAFSESEWLNDAEKVLIAVDEDAAGQNLENELAHRFGKHRCWRVHFPEMFDVKCKDANETLMDHGVEVLKECVENATPYPVDGLHLVKDYYNQVLDFYSGNIQKPISTGFANLDKVYQVMPGTFQLITGIPNHGKSNFLDQLIINIAQRNQWKFAIFSPEHSAALHIRRLVEKVVKKPFDIGLSERMSPSELSNAMEWLNHQFFFIENKEAVPDIDYILDRARAACMQHSIKGLVIDPFNKIAQNRATSVREDEHIRDIIAKCQKFCISHNVTLWMVAHPHKLHRSENGAYNPPSLYEVAGSAHWNNMCDVGMVVHRDFDTNTTRVIMRKIREQGLYGEIGEAEFKYNVVSRVYEEKEVEQSAPPRYWMDKD